MKKKTKRIVLDLLRAKAAKAKNTVTFIADSVAKDASNQSLQNALRTQMKALSNWIACIEEIEAIETID